MSEETKNTAAKTTAAKKPTAKKTTTRKPAAKKPAAKTAASKSTAAKKTTTAAKKPAAKKTTARKPAAKKTTTRKTTAKPAAAAAAKTADAAVKAETVEQPKSESANEQSTASKQPGNTFEDITMDTLKDQDWPAIIKRAAFTILYGFLGWLAVVTGISLVVVHLVLTIITGSPNEELKKWLVAIGAYVAQIFAFLSFADDTPPFPLGRDFPVED